MEKRGRLRPEEGGEGGWRSKEKELKWKEQEEDGKEEQEDEEVGAKGGFHSGMNSRPVLLVHPLTHKKTL